MKLSSDIPICPIIMQAEKPKLNFKDRYSEKYRNAHPAAPLVVPWVSGVVSL